MFVDCIANIPAQQISTELLLLFSSKKDQQQLCWSLPPKPNDGATELPI